MVEGRVAEGEEKESAATKLERRLWEDIKKYEDYVKWRRLQTLGLRVGAAFLGAAASVCIGLQGNHNFASSPNTVGALAALALVFSALVTVMSAWDGVFDYKSDWERFKITYGRLYGLQYNLSYQISKGVVSDEDLNDIAKKHAEFIQEANNPRWKTE
jgi:Protein of unknown function (DUF4231)